MEEEGLVRPQRGVGMAGEEGRRKVLQVVQRWVLDPPPQN